MELQQALEQFLLLDRARSTRDTYRKILVRFAKDIGPGRPLELIKTEDVNAYVLKLRDRESKWASHPTRPEVDEPLSPATVYKHIKTIKRFFNWCIERGYIAHSPARLVSSRRPDLPLGEGKAATPSEVAAILAQAHKPRDRAIVLLLAQSGARASEIAGLKIRNLWLSDHTAVVDGKGSKRREIFYSQEAEDAIRAWLEIRPDVTHNYVFTSTRGKGKLTPQAISQITRRLSVAAGLDHTLGAHSFRHYVGMTLARKHIPLSIIQVYLGHSDPSVTLQYLRSLNRDAIREASDILFLDGG